MKFIRTLFILTISGLHIGCGTSPLQKEYKSLFQSTDAPVHLIQAPFIEQARNHCGPATLSMIAQKYDPQIKLKDVTEMTFTPGANGTFKGDMLSATRRLGFTAYKLERLEEILANLKRNHPVLVFQDTGALWFHYYHYAVLLGYDQKTESVFMHTGPHAYHREKVKEFLRTWDRGGRWSFVLLPPKVLPPKVKFKEALNNAMSLSRLGHTQGAIEVFNEMIKRWPKSYQPEVGLANEYISINEFKRGISYYQRAILKNPNHPGLYFNLGQIHYQIGEKASAKKLMSEAMQLATDEEKIFFKRRSRF